MTDRLFTATPYDHKSRRNAWGWYGYYFFYGDTRRV